MLLLILVDAVTTTTTTAPDSPRECVCVCVESGHDFGVLGRFLLSYVLNLSARPRESLGILDLALLQKEGAKAQLDTSRAGSNRKRERERVKVFFSQLGAVWPKLNRQLAPILSHPCATTKGSPSDLGAGPLLVHTHTHAKLTLPPESGSLE